MKKIIMSQENSLVDYAIYKWNIFFYNFDKVIIVQYEGNYNEPANLFQ